MASTRISIVTPSFNQAHFVEHTIKSIVDQNYDNLEYIVVDGGSTDGSADIIKRYLPQISYFVSEPDNGHGNAINKGFQRSTGEIMAWLNSDDMYLPWTFATVADIFDRFPDIDWITGARAMWTDRGVLMPDRPAYKSIHDFLAGNFEWIQQESVFWRRRLWEKAGGRIDESCRLMIDGELWTRFFRVSPLWNVNGFLSGYRTHTANRGVKFINDCRAEMRAAIEVMRRSLSPTELAGFPSEYPFVFYDTQKSAWVRYIVQRSPQGQPLMATGRYV